MTTTTINSGYPVQARTGHSATAWKTIESVLLKHHDKPDLQAARAVIASVCSHRQKGAPVWPMIVAPPGSMKTHLLDGLDGLPQIHFIDQVTPKTFISGQIEDSTKRSKVPASLLHRIGDDGIIVYPDFSTVLGMKHDDKASVLADMRRIYDGHLSKEFGTGDNVAKRAWKGRITFVVAVTPAIDGFYSVFQTLGERFVMIRWPRTDGMDAALAAMNQNTEQAKGELKAAVRAFFDQLPDINPELPPDIQRKIAALTEIAVRGRTHVPRSGYNKDIVYVPEPESPTRLAQQLAQLAKGAALLEGQPTVSEADYALVRRVAFDCLPPARAKILKSLIQTGDLKDAEMPASTLKYATEELEAHGLLSRRTLSSFCKGLLVEAGCLGQTYDRSTVM